MIRVGCSGFYYPNWKNKFYPKGLPQSQWLSYYSSVFNTVELNGAFYRLPKSTDLKRYYQMTPADFTFSVKVSRYITHVKRLSLKQSILDFHDLIRDNLRDKLQHLLYQFPSNFRYDEVNADRIVSNVPNDPHSVVEFRHTSWWNDAVKTMLAGSHITFANIDYPGLTTHVMNTSSNFYLRLHGNPVLFASSYSDECLQKFRQQIPDNVNSASVYFNNTMHEAGYKNAAQFMTIAKTH